MKRKAFLRSLFALPAIPTIAVGMSTPTPGPGLMEYLPEQYMFKHSVPLKRVYQVTEGFHRQTIIIAEEAKLQEQLRKDLETKY